MLKNKIEIGSHSVNHDNMKNLTDDQLKYELEESKRILERDLSIDIRTFCYPGGAYDNRTIEAVQSAGYDSAVTVIHSIKQDPKKMFELRRSHIDDDLENLVKRIKGEMP